MLLPGIDIWYISVEFQKTSQTSSNLQPKNHSNKNVSKFPNFQCFSLQLTKVLVNCFVFLGAFWTNMWTFFSTPPPTKKTITYILCFFWGSLLRLLPPWECDKRFPFWNPILATVNQCLLIQGAPKLLRHMYSVDISQGLSNATLSFAMSSLRAMGCSDPQFSVGPLNFMSPTPAFFGYPKKSSNNPCLSSVLTRFSASFWILTNDVSQWIPVCQIQH